MKATGVPLVVTADGWAIATPPDPFPRNAERSDVHAVEAPGEGVPMGGLAGAGPPAVAPDQVEEWFDLQRRWLRRVDSVLEVRGQSMEPLLTAGDLVGVRLLDDGQEPRVGQVCAVWWPDSGEVQVKVWAGHIKGQTMLLSSNGAYPPILADPGEVVPRGTVFGVLRLAELRIGLLEFPGWQG